MNKKYNLITIISLVIVLFILGMNHQDSGSNTPVNNNASPEAKSLLNFLYQISGKYILSAHHNKILAPTMWNEEVKKMTGDYPVIWGGDFNYNFGGKDPDMLRQAMIDNAKEVYKKGQIITLMWHACYPDNRDSCSRGSIWVMDNVVPQQEWDSLTTSGTELNNLWRAQADKIAKYLKQLQDENIPVLWRPYHEMNGVWFWWCQHQGEEGFARLWKMMFDYFTNHHKLNNLIWVWNANAPRDIPGDEAYAYKDYFPGIEYVDVLASDVYHNDYKQSHHDDLLELAEGKPISLGEVGQMPTPEILNNQPQWTWFMGWSEYLNKANKPDSVKILYNYPRTITLNELTRNKDGSYEIHLK